MILKISSQFFKRKFNGFGKKSLSLGKVSRVQQLLDFQTLLSFKKNAGKDTKKTALILRLTFFLKLAHSSLVTQAC